MVQTKMDASLGYPPRLSLPELISGLRKEALNSTPDTRMTSAFKSAPKSPRPHQCLALCPEALGFEDE